jgi:putative oxidoreductase
MNGLLSTNSNNWAALITRITLGIIIFPHGAQKVLGWFGGGGFEGTMSYLTGAAGLPWIIAFLVIMIEFLGSLFLVFGFLTRPAAFGMLAVFIGIILTAQIANGFFMNWSATPGVAEGFEYHLLVIGISVALLIAGGGKASVDAALTRTSYVNSKRS